MTVKEYMAREGIDITELSRRLGVADVTVRTRTRKPMPPAWAKRLGDETLTDAPAPAHPAGSERVPIADEPPLVDEAPADPDSPGGRVHEGRPQAPPGAPRVPPPPAPGPPAEIDYGALETYIVGVYELVARGVEGTDPPLAQTIKQNAGKAGKAWVVYIRSEPRIAALLQRMMIATPLGELVGVHIGIGIGYYFARRAYADALEQRVADDLAARDAAAHEPPPG